LERDAKQQEAVALCVDTSKRVVAITGEAGTGKTSILKEVWTLLIEAGYKVVLAAPTGKAAKRIFEATGIPAMTCHRLLEYSHPGEKHPKTGKVMGVSAPTRDYQNPLEYDVVLVDEYAMANWDLHRNLLDALPRGGRIRMFGDVRQLTPIEEMTANKAKPSPFTEMLGKMPCVTLETNYRQNAGSGIITNALAVNRRRMPRRFDDFALHVTDQPVNKVLDLVGDYMAAGVDFASISNQIITPTNVRWTGTWALNQRIQDMLADDDKPFLDLPRHPWMVEKKVTCKVQPGTKVIYTENNYELEVFNGESGRVVEFSEYGEVIIDLGDREVAIPPEQTYTDGNGKTRVYDPRKAVDLAYAITTHKSQGSEYEHVMYVLNKSTVWMQGQHNTYTAITRARRKVDLVCDQRSLSTCVMPEKAR
jgi:exodeoxyribonuclease V alpha subunit